MVFKIIIEVLTSLILVIRNFCLLIFLPYKTMRKISREKDYWQVFIILLVVFAYFKFVYFLRDKPNPATLVFFVFLFHFLLTIFFFYFLSWIQNKKLQLSSFIFTFSYSLIPSLIWFLSNSVLYLLIPPPRTFSLLGRGFSIFFVAYSLSLLTWKVILFYLAIRFSSKLGFYRIIYFIFLYLIWFLPYSIFLYHMKLFRIPFI